MCADSNLIYLSSEKLCLNLTNTEAERFTGKTCNLSITRCVSGGSSFLWIFLSLCSQGVSQLSPGWRARQHDHLHCSNIRTSACLLQASAFIIYKGQSHSSQSYSSIALHHYTVLPSYLPHTVDMSWLLIAVTSNSVLFLFLICTLSTKLSHTSDKCVACLDLIDYVQFTHSFASLSF